MVLTALNVGLGLLAVLSVVLLLWQWSAAVKFPLHRRLENQRYAPAVTLLKPLKGSDSKTRDCLRTWLTQNYDGPIQVLFGVAAADDPVCEVVRNLMAEFPSADIQLVVSERLTGANLKVSKLAHLEKLAKNDLLVVSDADVLVPSDLLANITASFQSPETGVVNCFYRFANPANLAMEWEAVAVNADFWSQVLQSQTLKPIDFALGAVMALRRQTLAQIGGFQALEDCLADDYQLGQRIVATGRGIHLSTLVVECWSDPMRFADVWKHQLRWARTIRVCQAVPYFFSILSNPTLWPLLWLCLFPSPTAAAFAAVALVTRCACALDLQRRLARGPVPLRLGWLAPMKDILQCAIWLLAFAGNKIEWRGQKMRLRRDGTLLRNSTSQTGHVRPA